MSKERVPGSHLSWWRLDCLAGVGGLELRDVVAKYPFESSHRFPVIQPNSGRREYSRSSCDGGRRSSGPVPGSRQDACAGRNCRDLRSGMLEMLAWVTEWPQPST